MELLWRETIAPCDHGQSNIVEFGDARCTWAMMAGERTSCVCNCTEIAALWRQGVTLVYWLSCSSRPMLQEAHDRQCWLVVVFILVHGEQVSVVYHR